MHRELADRICSFNRHYAEPSGYFEYAQKNSYLKDIGRDEEVTYYDSVTGKPLYIAPRGRSFAEFLEESRSHGWPSFRDEEVVWENVRCLKNGEAISVDGTHVRQRAGLPGYYLNILAMCVPVPCSCLLACSPGGGSLLIALLVASNDSLVTTCQTRREIDIV